MTASTLDRPSTYTRDRDVPTLPQVEFAAQTVDDLAAHKPVYVSVEGEGGGWCVTAVDVYAFTYDVWRDRRELTVPWGAVGE